MSIVGETRALLNNEAFVAALESVRTQCIDAALRCGVMGDEKRRRYLDAANTVDRVKAHLQAILAADDAQQAQLEAEKIERFYIDRAQSRFSRIVNRVVNG